MPGGQWGNEEVPDDLSDNSDIPGSVPTRRRDERNMRPSAVLQSPFVAAAETLYSARNIMSLYREFRSSGPDKFVTTRQNPPII